MMTEESLETLLRFWGVVESDIPGLVREIWRLREYGY